MTFDLNTVVVLFTTILVGLTAGLCFTWSNAVTPGIGQLNDYEFLQSFQKMNRAIINPIFLLVFFGPFFGHFINIYLHRNDNTISFWMLVLAASLFIFGVVAVTIFKNIPLNEMLDKTDLISASKEELFQLRKKFEKPWNFWHTVRTISSIISFSLLLINIIWKQSA